MFVKNGIAVSGIILTDEQDETLTKLFPFHNRIWVLDNYRFEKEEVIDSIKEKLKNNETLFFYPNDFSDSKDLNDFCVKKGLDFIDPDLLISGCFSGDRGLLKLAD
jgi:6-phosphogluconate dehydrogenase (decarboxylating)